MTDFDLSDKVALVTGGGSGIGAACAMLFARRGARVMIADRDMAAAERVAKEIDASAHAFQVDVSDPVACRDMVAEVMETFGRNKASGSTASVPASSTRRCWPRSIRPSWQAL